MRRLRSIGRLPVKGEDIDPEVKIQFFINILDDAAWVDFLTNIKPLFVNKDQDNSV